MKKQRESERVLTEAERRRAARLAELTAEYEAKGFRVCPLLISLVRANVVGPLLMLPLAVLAFLLFVLVSPAGFRVLSGWELPVFIAAMAALIVLHELVHGLTWACFTEKGWKSIEFGFIKKYLTPYCTCSEPLKKGQYVLGALMPLLVCGLLPALIAAICGSMLLLWLSEVMIFAASGDVMIVGKILTHRSEARETVYLDHPTEAGLILFER